MHKGSESFDGSRCLLLWKEVWLMKGPFVFIPPVQCGTIFCSYHYSYGSSSKPKPCLVQRQAGGGPNDQRPHLVATPKQSLNMAPRNRQVPYTGLFVSPSGISDICGTVAGVVTPKGSMSTEGETLHISVLTSYRRSICPPLVTRQMSIF